MGRRLVHWALVLLVVGGPRSASTGPEREPDTRTLAPHATAYLEHARTEGREPALDRLEAEGEDPWIVAEELLLLGETEAARTLATASVAGVDAALRTYLERAPAPAPESAHRIARAQALLEAGDAEGALKALPEIDATELSVTAVRALRSRVDVLHALDRAADAKEIRDRLTDLVDAIGWKRAAIAAYVEGLREKGGTDESEETRRILSRLVGLDHESRDMARSASWCARLGRLELKHNRPALARTWLLEAESLLAALAANGELPRELLEAHVDTLTSLTVVQLRLGDVGSGFATAFHAYDDAKALDQERRMAAARALAMTFSRVRRWEEAEQYQREAIALADARDALLSMRLQGDLALLLLNQGRHNDARVLYGAVYASDAIHADKRASYIARLHRASDWINRPADELEIEGLQRAMIDLSNMRRDLEKESADLSWRSEMQANATAMVGRALNLLGRSSEALPLLREVAAAAASDAVVRALLPYVRLELARALRRSAQAKEALTLTSAAVAALREEVQALLPAYALTRLSDGEVGELIREHLATVLEADSPQATIEALEATRGIAFLSEAGRRQREHSGRRLRREEDTIEALAREVARLARAYWEIQERRAPRPEIRKAHEALWAGRLRLRRTEERLGVQQAVSRKKPSGSPSPLSFHSPPALRPGEAMLYYAEPGAGSVAVLQHDDRRQVFRLGARVPLEARLAAALSTWIDEDAKESEKALETLLAGVFPEDLVKTLTRAEDARPGVDHVYVSVAGGLARLPWPVLLREALRRAGKPDEKLPTVSLLASQAVLRHLRTWNQAAGGGPLLAVADPDYRTEGARRSQMRFFGRALDRLPASAEEARALVEEERGDVLLKGEQASEPYLRHCLFDAPYPFDVLHFSCHGLLYGETPWLSGLALHATAEDDGLVTVDDVGHWHFQGGPRMVVLAACKSGLGAPIPGEGEEGLVRAFLLAGARHVVASLWNVPDESSRDLMIAFHRYRRKGLSPPRALVRAQMDVKTSGGPQGRPPYAWAGWAVWGPKD